MDIEVKQCVMDKEGKFAGSIIYSRILGYELWKAVNREYMIPFEPYKDKVEIIPKPLVVKGSKEGISISELCRNIDTVACMKMDIEGAESKILQSESELLRTNIIERLLVCTYCRCCIQ